MADSPAHQPELCLKSIPRRPSRVATAAVLAAAAFALAGCGASSDGSSSGNPTTSGAGTLWVIDYLSLKGADIRTGKVNTSASLVEVAPSIYTLVPGPTQVWAGLSDGGVLVLDKASGAQQMLRVDSVETWGIDAITLAGGFAYVGSGAKPAGSVPTAPPLVQIDTTTLAEKSRLDVFGAEFNESYRTILADTNSLWVLRESGFAAMQIDLATLSVKDTLFLAEDPSDPTGPRQDLYGYGGMVQVGGTLWAVDESSTRFSLLKIDKATHAVTYVRALADEFGQAAQDCVNAGANQDSVFLLFCHEGKIARLDAQTGATLQTYDLGGTSASNLAVKGDKLYVQSPAGKLEIIEVDVASGEQRVVYKASGLISGFAVE